ncbi:clock-controlled protein 6 [Chaetomium sp. MPI-SDFR-AT-0129]|uniref:Uncharacterized protein n=1 Tax=Dichotomopilus funicola TaxID=1934379 RepID=A0AAN6ZMT4_9PEZI|nr:clock-controlled protein 6 [Chaetomium sp. MPI-SDFR-AT-0129]KAK4144232.1 hypothetical protein C8A04DRAFT_28135 [Dichotomopilus funicola]
MKFTTVLALATGAMATAHSSVSYTTKVVTAVTTYIPAPTEIAYGANTYTVTEATHLTLTDGPYTIKVPVTTITSVLCEETCTATYHNSTSTSSSLAPSFPPPSFSTTPTVTGTGSLPAPTAPGGPSGTSTSPPIETAGAGRVAMLSGGALAGVLGFAALAL